jgi:hypothetical protein
VFCLLEGDDGIRRPVREEIGKRLQWRNRPRRALRDPETNLRLGAILAARIGTVVYGADDPKKGAVVSLYTLLSDTRLGKGVRVERGVLQDEISDLLKSFFAGKR